MSQNRLAWRQSKSSRGAACLSVLSQTTSANYSYQSRCSTTCLFSIGDGDYIIETLIRRGLLYYLLLIVAAIVPYQAVWPSPPGSRRGRS